MGGILKIFSVRNSYLLVFIFFSHTLISSKSNAQSREITEAFNTSWFEDYVPLACSDNILRLSSKLDTLIKADVVHIFHRQVPYTAIKPLMFRKSLSPNLVQTKSWVFHAFLLLDKTLVLDFDYSNSPNIITLKEHLLNMWDQKELMQNYRFQIKKISDYSKFDTDGFMNDKPVLTYEEFIDLF